MTVNASAFAIITSHEGCKLETYLDLNGIPTIGYGHCGPEVEEGATITASDADALLRADLDKFDDGVARVCEAATDNQHSAMVSLAYNIGLGNFGASSVCRFHNAGLFEDAANAFGLWNRAGGKVQPGLVSRRNAESDLYRQG